MKALVTGAGGFIGSHVVEELLKTGNEVRALIRYNSTGNRGWLSTINQQFIIGNSTSNKQVFNKLEPVWGDVRDSSRMRALVKDCDVVFHLAALIAIPYSYISPESYIDTNVKGTLNVLEAARAVSNDLRVVLVSTSEVYGTAQFAPITESHPLNAQSPYAASKVAADQLGLSYHRAFGQSVSVVRPFNTYGPRQSARAIIPTILSQLLSGKRPIRLGSLSPTRDLTFVEDTARGIVEVGVHPQSVGQVLQLGSGREISIGDLARLCAETVGKPLEIEADNQRLRPGKSEVERLISDYSRAGTLCGYRPQVSLEEGLKKTARWIEANLAYYQVEEYRV